MFPKRNIISGSLFPARNIFLPMNLPIPFAWIWRILFLLCLACFSRASLAAPQEVPPLRIGINASVLRQSPQVYLEWQRYLSAHLNRPVEFVQRETHREMIDLVRNRMVEFAWLSHFPYAYLASRERARYLVNPVARDRAAAYSAYLIVPAADTVTHSIADLRGRIFAFADPYSFTGFHMARYWLRQIGERDPSHFFRKTFFTYSHHNTVIAVAKGLANGGVVESHALTRAVEREPDLAGQIRIVTRSADFGYPPIVSVPPVSGTDAALMRDTLLAMAHSAEGRRLLDLVGLAGFEVGDPQTYKSVLDIVKAADKP